MKYLRLSQSIIPLEYRIIIEPISPDFEVFYGTCDISFINNDNTNTITLNCYDISIKKVILREENRNYSNYIVSYDKDNQQVMMFFDHVPKRGYLTVKYTGIINTCGYGISKTMDNDQMILYACFEPIYARRCFPCFDEPNFRARFKIEIISPPNKTVLSNTMIKKAININENNVRYIFHKSLPMSTYLVSFYIGNLECKSGISKNGILIRIFGNQSEEYLEFVLDNVIRSLDLLEDLLDLRYPMPKLDVLFIPNIYPQGMECWGLIIIKKNDTVDFSNLTHIDKIKLVYVIFHEMAHQWFGNIVTINWWSEIWLKEGFSTWMGWFIMDKLYPEWKSYKWFYLWEVIKALEADSLINTHPIRSHIGDLYDINMVYDSVLYSKGAVVIFMLIRLLGIETFFDGIRHYLKKFYLGSANINDFTACMEEISEKSISEFIDNWVYNKNFPIINIKKIDGVLYYEQEMFYLNNFSSNKNVVWNIPLSGSLVLKKKFDLISSKYLMEKNIIGFYLFNYQHDTIEHIIKNKLYRTDIELGDVLNSIYMCLKFGRLEYSKYILYIDTIMNKLKKNYVSGMLMEIIRRHFENFQIIIRDSNHIAKYKSVLKPYVIFVLEKIGLTFDPNDDADLFTAKKNALHLACLLRIKKYVYYLDNLFNSIVYTNNWEKDRFIREIIIQNALMNKIKWEKNFFTILRMFENNSKKFLISILALVPNLDDYYHILDLFFSNIKCDHWKADIIANAGKNFMLNKYLWIYVKNRWTSIYRVINKFIDCYSIIINIFMYMVDDDGTLINDIGSFFSNSNIEFGNIHTALTRSIEHIKLNTFFNQHLRLTSD